MASAGSHNGSVSTVVVATGTPGVLTAMRDLAPEPGENMQDGIGSVPRFDDTRTAVDSGAQLAARSVPKQIITV